MRQTISAALFFIVALLLCAPAFAAVGDGEAVYGSSSATTNPRARAYTDASNPPFGAAGATNTTAATIMWVTTKANPQANEYYAASASDTTDDTLYIQSFDGTTWTLDVTATDFVNMATATFYKSFDLEIEQSSGDALVVYENSGTADTTFAYYWRDPNVQSANNGWVGPCTFTYGQGSTNGIIQWVKMAHHPTSDEIALAMSDSNDDLIVMIWSGANKSTSCATLNNNWTAEPTSELSTTLSAQDVRKFDVAYEQTSGDVLVAYSVAATAKVGFATKLSGQTTWTNNAGDTSFLDAADAIALCPEPSTDYIGMYSIAASALDSQFGIWDGSAWATHANNQDTATGATTALHEVVACGWAGSGSGRLAVFPYKNSANSTKLDYFTWNKTTGSTCKADQCSGCTSTNCTPASSPAVFVNGLKNHIRVDQWPGNSAQMLVEVLDSNSDYWVLKFDGTSTTTNWTVLDDNSGSNVALDSSTTTATPGPMDTALTAYDPTPVAQVSNIVTQRDGSTTTFAWDTATESRVKGFHVARAEIVNGQPGAFTRVTDHLIPAAGGTMAGHAYRVQDASVVPGHTYAYQLEMIGQGGERVVQQTEPVVPDLGGRLTRLDPATHRVEIATPDAPVMATAHLARTGKHLRWQDTRDGLMEMIVPPAKRAANKTGTGTPSVTRRAAVIRAESPAARAKHPHEPTALKLHVHAPGIYRVTGDELAAAGWNLTTLNADKLGLVAQGHPVPIRLVGVDDGKFDAQDALEFWGEPLETRYYKENIYWLTDDHAGARMHEHPMERKGGTRPLSYMETVRLDEDEVYYPESPSAAHWFMDHEFFAPDSADVALTLDHVQYVSEPAQLTVGLQGMSKWGYAGDGVLADPRHNRQHVIVSVNGTVVGEHEWFNDTYATATFDVPATLLQEGANTVTIEATDEGGLLEQFFLVDDLQLDYPRAFAARADGLTFASSPSPGKATYHVTDFPSEQVLAYVLRSPKHRQGGDVEFLTDAQVLHDANGAFVEITDRPAHHRSDRYAILPPDAVRAVDVVEADTPSTLRNDQFPNYLIIAPQLFHETLADFATKRQARVVDVQDIYDEYSGGLPDPSAIRDFVLSANQRGVKTVLLVGDGHFDFRDFQGSGVPEYIPPALVFTRYVETVWDGWFATPEGAAVPKLAIGRWPVRTVEELQAVIAKTLAYDAGGSGSPRNVFVSDDEPVFRATEDQLADLVPSTEEPIKLYYGDAMDAPTTRSRLFEEINRGAKLLSYDGHGGVQLWSSARLLTTDDVETLTNAGHYPILLTLGCLSGYFAYPTTDLDSIAERLLLAPDKGIVGTLSPAGLSSTPEQQLLGSQWLDALEHGQTMGAALLAAQQAAAAQLPTSTAANLIETFNLLGDPSLRLR